MAGFQMWYLNLKFLTVYIDNFLGKSFIISQEFHFWNYFNFKLLVYVISDSLAAQEPNAFWPQMIIKTTSAAAVNSLKTA